MHIFWNFLSRKSISCDSPSDAHCYFRRYNFIEKYARTSHKWLHFFLHSNESGYSNRSDQRRKKNIKESLCRNVNKNIFYSKWNIFICENQSIFTVWSAVWCVCFFLFSCLNTLRTKNKKKCLFYGWSLKVHENRHWTYWNEEATTCFAIWNVRKIGSICVFCLSWKQNSTVEFSNEWTAHPSKNNNNNNKK